jgi:hypothetical protein
MAFSLSASHTEYVFKVNSSRVGLGSGGWIAHSFSASNPSAVIS